MKLFLLLLPIIFITSFSFAMEQQQEGDKQNFDTDHMTDEELLLFHAMVDLAVGAHLSLNNPDFVPAIQSDCMLRETLGSIIRKKISNVDECLAINRIYNRLTQKKDINAILYMFHKDNIDYNYVQAVTMYNSGYYRSALEWIKQTTDDVEAAFVHLAETKQDEYALQEAYEINKLIQTAFLNEIYVYYPQSLCNCRTCTNYQ